MYGKINLWTPRTCVIELGKKKILPFTSCHSIYEHFKKIKIKTPFFFKVNKKTEKSIKPRKLKKR
jgi:hypothetical protein